MKLPLNIVDTSTRGSWRQLEAFKLRVKEYLRFTTDRLLSSDLLMTGVLFLCLRDI